MSVLGAANKDDVCFNFINSLKSDVAKKNYEREIKKFMNYCRFFPLLTIFILCFFFFIIDQNDHILGQNQIESESINESSALTFPSLSDRNLKIETVATGFAFPTGITFFREQ